MQIEEIALLFFVTSKTVFNLKEIYIEEFINHLLLSFLTRPFFSILKVAAAAAGEM